jgi:electron transfer flavoprotein beta subunit
MKIVVCLKQILDPELPPSLFEIDENLKGAKIGKHPFVISPYDENALEMALQLKDGGQDTHVIALTFGDERAEDALRKALGVLADEAVWIPKKDGPVEDAIVSSGETARVLVGAIKEIGSVDLVVCGRQAGDSDAGQVPLFIAEAMGIPAVSFVHRIDMRDGRLILTRQVEMGTEIFEAMMPAVVTVTNDDKNLLRIAKVRDVMKAHRKPVRTLTGKEIELSSDGESINCGTLDKLFIPVVDNVCEMIGGDDPGEKVAVLLKKLRDQKTL